MLPIRCHVLTVMKKNWPRISKITLRGKPSFMVDARFEGKGSRNFFNTRTEAEGFAQQARIRRENEGGTVFDDRGLARHGWTVAMAIRHTLDYLNTRSASILVSDAVGKMLSAKAAAGRDREYLLTLRWFYNRFLPSVTGKTMAEITTPDVNTFLESIAGSPVYRNGFRRVLSTLFSYGIKNGYCTLNPATNAERAATFDKPPGIVTPAQAAAILSASKGDMLAYHAIGFFAGLRVAELHRLDWSDVDLAGGYVHVSAENAKTRARRLVPILDPLRAWITPVAKTSGKITQKNFKPRLHATRKAAGITEWPANGMRHSFVSYRLADTGNAALTALEAGHDQAILFRHYRELVKPKDATRYFSIRPASEAGRKVVAMVG